jgi:Xaa-Pro aminopeptidase
MVRRMPDVLLFADTYRTPELRHEVPIGVPDPFLYAEKDGAKHVVVWSAEQPRIASVGNFELHSPEEYGLDELIGSGRDRKAIRAELQKRAVQALGITSAVVPESFPLWFADLLRADGIEVSIDQDLFDDRRRVKNDAELAGMRRAQRAAQAAMDKARELLRHGPPLTVEDVKSAMQQVFAAHNTICDDFIVAPGAQGAVGHDMGSGPIEAGAPIVIDIWPRDNESAIYCDFTRTYVIGDVPDEVREWHRLVKEALDRAVSEIKEGVTGRAIFDGSCDIFEAAGEPTQRTKKEGETLSDGFFHGLGHGVGLEVHEEPGLGMIAKEKLRAGDVVTVEPGLYRQGYGGVRLEDLVLVTKDGAENLTQYPYDLTP